MNVFVVVIPNLNGKQYWYKKYRVSKIGETKRM